MRMWWLIALAACGAGMRSPNRIEAQNIFTVDVSAPARDLQWRGFDSRVGGYAVGNCTLGYDAGIHQGGLMPDAEQQDWQYRVTRVDGRAVRWARYQQDVPKRTGPFWLALYLPGLEIEVACPTAAERDAAVAWLDTVRFGDFHGKDLLDDKPITGPATWSPQPAWCEVTTGAPVGGTSQATLIVEPPPGTQLGLVVARIGGTGLSWVADPQTTFTQNLQAGRYELDISSVSSELVTCKGIELSSGQVTTVRVLQFSL